ncbi:MAG: hypothetical protein ACFFD4_05105 [Candidatus Odinarchaeota archaeon]
MPGITILSQWDQLFQGWLFLIESVPSFLWSLLIISAFVVRAIACIVFIYSLGERVFFDAGPKSTKRVLLCLLVITIVTVPFLFVDQESMLLPSFR